ncbi:zinc-dependent alcohol dehydrogenase [Streptacidiphilus cavernicola]|uniref:2-deoxy-scyllo-inosamine dehydrogenase n=1 Tax=Streptacidiphilus cavernicola TaxID=3342716 RepID=A0ABV6W0D1_9ACTN
MKALTYQGPWDLRITDVPDPAEPRRDDVVVKVHRVGICGTDLGIATGRYDAEPGVVMGHEAVGEVVATGPDVQDLRPGTLVAVNPTYFCGACHLCATGRPNHCRRKLGTEAGVSADGLFAEYFSTTRRFVHPVTGGPGSRNTVLSEPLACVLTGVGRLSLSAQMHAAVLGAGPMGVLYAARLAQYGLRVTLVEQSAARADRVRAVGGRDWSLVRTLEQVPGAEDGRLDVVVDTTGHLLEPAVARLSPGGQLLLVGLSGGTATVEPASIADNSLQILGSIDSLGTFADAVDLLETGTLPLNGTVTAEVPMADFATAFALLGVDLRSRRRTEPSDHLKVCLQPGKAE